MLYAASPLSLSSSSLKDTSPSSPISRPGEATSPSSPSRIAAAREPLSPLKRIQTDDLSSRHASVFPYSPVV